MKKLLAALCMIFALIAGNAQAAAEIGKTAPDVTFTDVNGNEHSISGFKGKTVILEWTNEGCPFVQKFYKPGEMQRLQQEATTATDTVWITINSSAEGEQGYIESDEAAQEFVAQNKLQSTAYVRDVTGEFGKAYDAKTTPHMYVINADGVLVYQGAIDSIKSVEVSDIGTATNYVTETLKALKDGKLPATSSTAPYGCNVKYAK